MALPVSRYPALKARKVLRLLHKIGYEQVRQTGSHRKLEAEGRLPIIFAFHDGKKSHRWRYVTCSSIGQN